jgi:tetratricopeptide (TPR) repeat protein
VIWAVLIASAVLVGVAAAGILRPFGASVEPGLERQPDPLEDERSSLLRALKDLDAERAQGSLSEEDYRALRSETERRAVAVLRALDARDGAGELAGELKELRPTSSVVGGPEAGSRWRSRRTISLLVAAAVAAVAAVALVGAVHARSGDAAITGFGTQGDQDPLAFFEQRVRDHPNDVAARLDLGSRYLQAGNVPGAVTQYLAALELDPHNAEAHANLGWVLYQAGKPDEAMAAEDQALQADPGYAEALYFKGVILLKGLNRPRDAAEAFEAYLAAAPFGSLRDEVEQLLSQARSGSPSPSFSPSPSA